MMTVMGGLPARAIASLALLLLVLLTAPGWILFPVLPPRSQRGMLKLVVEMVNWAGAVTDHSGGRQP